MVRTFSSTMRFGYSVSETIDDVVDSVKDWYNNGGGKEIVHSDIDGAAEGAITGGKQGAVIDGAASSTKEIIDQVME